MIWQDSKMSSLYYDDTAASEGYPCVVKITDADILVEYEDEDQGTVQYTGKNDGTGHFKLASATVTGEATLHMFPGSSVLEGSWRETGYRGMWRIDLA